MSDRPQRPTGFSLQRWSQRKLEAARKDDPARRPEPARNGDVAPGIDPGANAGAITTAPPGERSVPSTVTSMPNPAPGAEHGERSEAPHVEGSLPPIESLTIDSDFSPFMRSGVDEDVKRAALRKLLRDPRFNVMDGLDVYIDDYSKPSPIEPELVRTLMQARYIFNPPKTRVNEQGNVEDVPEKDDVAAAVPEALAQPAATASEAAAAPGFVDGPVQCGAVGAREYAELTAGAATDNAEPPEDRDGRPGIESKRP